jgi:Cdc6-like AAA superfamily ATPase
MSRESGRKYLEDACRDMLEARSSWNNAAMAQMPTQPDEAVKARVNLDILRLAMESADRRYLRTLQEWFDGKL